MPTEYDKRIARNTFYIYGRMLLTMFISLYISRVVLDVLGVVDYGIYTVVGGIACGLGFLNSALAGATSRFLSYEIGTGNEGNLRSTFLAAFKVHVFLALLIMLLAESVGLWYVCTQLEMPDGRRIAAIWTYQFAILSVMVQIAQVPFTALIIAREKIGFYALVAFVNVFVKLGIVLLLYLATADNLVAYAAMMFGAILFSGVLYLIYCRKHFQECEFRGAVKRSVVRRMISFSSWNIYSTLCDSARTQGLQLVLNKFSGAMLLNAASGLTTTVSVTIFSFAQNVVIAFRPQIIQQYAKGDIVYMNKLLKNCACFSLLLIGIIVLPLLIGMDTVLEVWLKEVPQYTAVFCRLAVIAVLGQVVNEIVVIGVQSTGKVARQSLATGTLYLAELGAMWFLLKITREPVIVYVVHLVMIFIIAFICSIILKSKIPDFGMMKFWGAGVVKPIAILAVSMCVVLALIGNWSHNLVGVIGIACATTAFILILGWFFAIDAPTRRIVSDKIISKLRTGSRK